jgi:hypothetical protein
VAGAEQQQVSRVVDVQGHHQLRPSLMEDVALFTSWPQAVVAIFLFGGARGGAADCDGGPTHTKYSLDVRPALEPASGLTPRSLGTESESRVDCILYARPSGRCSGPKS